MPFVLDKNHRGRACIGFSTDDFEKFKAVVQQTFSNVQQLKTIHVDVQYFEYLMDGKKFFLDHDDLALSSFSANCLDGDEAVKTLYEALRAEALN